MRGYLCENDMEKYTKFGIHYMSYLHELAGSFFITRDYGFLEYRLEGPIVYVDAFYVVPTARQSGAGRMLRDAVEIVAREHGCTKMVGYIDTNLDGWATRKKIFESLGLEYDPDFATDVETYLPYRKDI